MNVTDLYEKYRIMPNLQLHQLRVAAVAQTIARHSSTAVDIEAVTQAGLLHDMGNILKFNLNTFPDLVPPESIPYWQSVKDEYEANYGADEHEATIAIVKEMGVSETVITLIDGVGFSKLTATALTDSIEQKIAEYSDLRVGPRGILSLTERIEEARARYLNRVSDFPRDDEQYRVLCEAAYEIERQLFEGTDLQPHDLNDESLATAIEALRSYDIA